MSIFSTSPTKAPLPPLPQRCDRCGLDIVFGLSDCAAHVDVDGAPHYRYTHSPRCPQLLLPPNADLELLLKAPSEAIFSWP